MRRKWSSEPLPHYNIESMRLSRKVSVIGSYWHGILVTKITSTPPPHYGRRRRRHAGSVLVLSVGCDMGARASGVATNIPLQVHLATWRLKLVFKHSRHIPPRRIWRITSSWLLNGKNSESAAWKLWKIVEQNASDYRPDLPEKPVQMIDTNLEWSPNVVEEKLARVYEAHAQAKADGCVRYQKLIFSLIQCRLNGRLKR